MYMFNMGDKNALNGLDPLYIVKVRCILVCVCVCVCVCKVQRTVSHKACYCMTVHVRWLTSDLGVDG